MEDLYPGGDAGDHRRDDLRVHGEWGAFLYPLAYLYTSSQMVLTVGIISDLIRGDVFQWGRIMAACLLASLPPILIYAFLMDYYVAGLTAGATKG